MTGFGPARDTLVYKTDHPMPRRKAGEVLVEVHATSINPGEWRVRQVQLYGKVASFSFTQTRTRHTCSTLAHPACILPTPLSGPRGRCPRA